MKLGFVSDTSFRKTLLSNTGILRKFPESTHHAGIFGLKLSQVSSRAGIFGLKLPQVSRIGPSRRNLRPETSASFQVWTIALQSAGLLFLPHRNVSE
jgi:hypothetical protein